VTPVTPLSPTYVPKIVAVYVPAVAVLNVTTVVHVALPVMHEGKLNVGAINPAETTALKTTLSTPLKPGKPFSAVAVIVAVGPADPFATVKGPAGLPVIATQAGFTELLNRVPVCTVAGFGAPAPPESVTQVPPGTLVPVQPVW